MEIIIGVLVVGLLLLSYTTFNLLRKCEKLEDRDESNSEILVGYLTYLERISQVIEVSNNKLQKLDYKGSFTSDDEIGFFFEQVKKIQGILNEFQLKKI